MIVQKTQIQIFIKRNQLEKESNHKEKKNNKIHSIKNQNSPTTKLKIQNPTKEREVSKKKKRRRKRRMKSIYPKK